MLSADEAATIRAALRYWLDEVVPHGPSVAQLYLDSEAAKVLGRAELERLIQRFAAGNLRCVATKPDSGRIDPPRLLTSDEAAALPARDDCLHTVIVAKRR